MQLRASSVPQVRSAIASAHAALRRLAVEADGQDIVEYAFLAAFIGAVGWLALNAILASVGVTYASWIDPNSGTPAVWEPPIPSGG